MDCKGFKKKLGAYLEGELSSEAQKACDRHLEDCAACKDFMTEFTQLWDMIDEFEPLKPSPYFKTRVKGRLQELQAKEQVRPVWTELVFNKLKPAITVAIVLIGIVMGYSIGNHLYTQQTGQSSELESKEELSQFVYSHYLNMLNEIPSGSMVSYYSNLNFNQ